MNTYTLMEASVYVKHNSMYGAGRLISSLLGGYIK